MLPTLGEVGGLAKTILRDLFNEERVEEDNSGSGEREAGGAAASQVYAGMGSHTKNSQVKKYSKLKKYPN